MKRDIEAFFTNGAQRTKTDASGKLLPWHPGEPLPLLKDRVPVRRRRLFRKRRGKR